MPQRKYNGRRPTIPESVKCEIRIVCQYSCLICTTSYPLEYAHIDGNRTDNSVTNLVLLCPNHHKSFDDGKIPKKDIRILIDRKKAESEEILKLKKQLDYFLGAKQVSVSSDFGKLQIQYQSKLSEFGDKLIFYQGFIYLISEFYLDSRGDKTRRKVRDLLNISSEQEQLIISHLINLGLAKTVGSIIFLQNNKDAKIALNELLNSGKISVEDIFKTFVNV
jgi:hypothetical protein